MTTMSTEVPAIKLSKHMSVVISSTGSILISTENDRARARLELYAQKGLLTLFADEAEGTRWRVTTYKSVEGISFNLEFTGRCVLERL